jgi:hypothetical protein
LLARQKTPIVRERRKRVATPNDTKEIDMRRRLTPFLIAVILAGGAYGSTLLANLANAGFKGTTIAMGTFDEMDLNAHTLPAEIWQSRLKTQGLSDLYIQSNVWMPGGSTGWHTHPGPSLIIVTEGTVMAYDSDDPTCTPHPHPAGTSFVDPGDGHVHVLRNEGSIDARTFAVQLIPAGAVRRIDADPPVTCPSTVN